VRSRSEFDGVSQDYSYIKKLGRVPGARWARWGPRTYVGGVYFSVGTSVGPQETHWSVPASAAGSASAAMAAAAAAAADAEMVAVQNNAGGGGGGGGDGGGGGGKTVAHEAEADPKWALGNNVMRSAQAVELLWARVGLTREHPVIFYCGSGWRASLAFFFAKVLLGWPHVRNFDGGWLEWSALHPNAHLHDCVTIGHVVAEPGEEEEGAA